MLRVDSGMDEQNAWWKKWAKDRPQKVKQA
jgi:hypothetical protein